VDQDCIKLAGYFSGHGFTGESLARLCGSGGVAASIVLRGTDRAGRGRHFRACRSPDLPENQVPAFEVICELLYRRGMDGATVLAGRGEGSPMMAVAIGSGQRLGLVLPEIGGLLRHPLITLEQIRVCKRDGRLISPPRAVPGTDADGRPLWHKLTVTSETVAAIRSTPER
jgi:PII-like signaling protein